MPRVLPGPWPMRVGALLLREARPDDVEHLLIVRDDRGVNRFMIHACAEPETFRGGWPAVDGTGQPGRPQLTRQGSATSSTLPSPDEASPATWYAEPGWVHGDEHAILDRERRATTGHEQAPARGTA